MGPQTTNGSHLFPLSRTIETTSTVIRDSVACCRRVRHGSFSSCRAPNSQPSLDVFRCHSCNVKVRSSTIASNPRPTHTHTHHSRAQYRTTHHMSIPCLQTPDSNTIEVCCTNHKFTNRGRANRGANKRRRRRRRTNLSASR